MAYELLDYLRSWVPNEVLKKAADMIEQQAKDIAELKDAYADKRAEIEQLKDDLNKYYDLGHNCSIELRHAQETLAEARAEVERLNGELKSANLARTRR